MLRPPQLVTNARMVYLVWVPADPGAVAGLVPDGLTPTENRAVFINQYVVDDGLDTSSARSPEEWGAYSLTYLGADLIGLDANEETPGRWWTHYLNSSDNMIRYAAAHGIPAAAGRTTVELDDRTLVATTFADGAPIIRTTARVEVKTPQRVNGQLRYITRVGGELWSGRYPFVGDIAEHFEIESVEFLESAHPVYALRPADPLTVTFGFYSPAISFCYPGGEGLLGSAEGS
jgi:hypothetical protein